MAALKIKKGDTVKVITGKDRGSTGKVMHIDRTRERLSVEGVNLRTKHVRPKRQGEKGEVVKMPAPLALSNVALVCPSCGKATRVSVKHSAKGRFRVCKHCNHEW